MSFFVSKEGNIRVGRIITTSVIGLTAVVSLFASFSTVPVGSTGVVVTLGQTQSMTLGEGFHIKAPYITHIVSMDNRIQKQEVSAAATSKDLQAVSTTIDVNFHLSPGNSNSMYQTIGQNYSEILLAPAIQESVKNVMAQYSAEQLITQRSTVSVSIREELENRMTEYGVIIDEFNITNFQFSAEFDAAIEAKQVAEQNKLKAQTEKEQRIIEAEAAAREKEVAAEAEANATLAKANAEAEAIRVKAEAEAEANQKLNQSLTSGILDYQAIQRWNGEYPTVMGGENTLTMIDVGKNDAPAVVQAPTEAATEKAAE
jgi:regulator of protease activity HflC (stomatin/prohibitin superfamily)